MSWPVVGAVAAGGILLAAGVGKAVVPGSVRPFLYALGVPKPIVPMVVAGLPVAEILTGALLLAGIRPWPARAALALSVLFLGTLWWARQSGVSVGCRCFGVLDSAVLTPVALVRAAVLVGLTAVLAVAQRSDVIAPGPVAAGAAAAFVFVVGFALVGKVYELEAAR